jgi:two-component system, chemotaxis family, chemotaxis protein CheY
MTGYDLSHLRILLVEDHKHMRHLVKEILTAFEIRDVRQCENGMRGIRELSIFPADVAVVDLAMEPLNGLDFTRIVRNASESNNPFMPIIMLTGYAEANLVSEARDAGVNEFLAKPVSARSLYQRIVSVIQEPRPFVKTNSYFGPDRRRRDNPAYSGPDRRTRALDELGVEELSDDDILAMAKKDS